MSSAEWIYKYIIKTRFFNIAKVKDKFIKEPRFKREKKYLLEYKSNDEWRTIYFGRIK